MTKQNVNARRPMGRIKLGPSGLLVGLSALALTGCGIGDWAEKKASEKLKKDVEEQLSAADKDGKKSDKKDAKGSTEEPKGETWTEQVTGEKIKLTRTKLEAGGLAGFTMLAPEGATVGKSPGGTGAEISESGYGFAVWVLEDPTATMQHMKAGATAWHKDGKIENEDGNSFIIAAKGIDGADAYYYKGIFKANGKTYRCETQSSIAPGSKAHAEAVDKVCESLELDGKSIATAGATPAAEEKVADAAEPAKVEPEQAGKPAAAVAVNTPPKPQAGPAAKPQAQPAPTAQPATKPAATPAPDKRTAAKAPCRCAKNDLMCNTRCSAR